MPLDQLPEYVLHHILGFVWLLDSHENGGTSGSVYRLRCVSKRLRNHIDTHPWIWPILPQKIDLPGSPNDHTPSANNAVAHMQALLRKGSAFQVIQTGATSVAGKLMTRLEHGYNKATRSDIHQNCLSVFVSGDSTPTFTMNFLPKDYQPQDSGNPALLLNHELMRRCTHMHAEVRALGHDVTSIDKAMCLFCAVTFRVRGSRRGEFHEKGLQWYTFHPSILVRPDMVRTVFGAPFLQKWLSSSNDQRRLLLAQCLFALSRLHWCKVHQTQNALSQHGYFCYDCWQDKKSPAKKTSATVPLENPTSKKPHIAAQAEPLIQWAQPDSAKARAKPSPLDSADFGVTKPLACPNCKSPNTMIDNFAQGMRYCRACSRKY